MNFAIKSAYGWSSADFKDSLKYQVLKLKLEDILVAKKDVSLFYIRYDSGNGGISYAQPEIEKVLVNIKAGSTFEKELARVYAEGEEGDFPTNADIYEQIKGLNSSNASITFEGKEDWVAISKLKTVGDYTGVVKSSGGYMAIFKLKSISSGRYNSWQEFLNSYPKQDQVLGSIEKPIVNLLTKISQKAFGCASGEPDTSYLVHFAALLGFVQNSTGGGLGAATVSATMLNTPEDIANHGDVCPSTFSGTNVFKGNYFTTSTVGGSGSYDLGCPSCSITGRKMTCYKSWDVTASLSGYYSKTKRVDFVNGVSESLDFQLVPIVPPCTPAATTYQDVSCGSCYTGTKQQQNVSSCPGPNYGGWTDINTSACAIISYNLSYNSNGGTPTPPTATYTCGSNATVAAAPSKNNWIFDGWYDNVGLTGSKLLPGTTLVINGNKTLYAKWNPTACVISVVIDPVEAGVVSNIATFTPKVTTTVTRGEKANIFFDAEIASTPITTLSGSQDFFHKYDGLGLHGATVNCTGTDDVIHTATATFFLKDSPQPCPRLCSTVGKSRVEGTANLAAAPFDYETILGGANNEDKPVEVNLTASVTDAAAAYWNYLGRFLADGSDSPNLVTTVTTPLRVTPWSNPIGGSNPGALKFTKYGKYSFNLQGLNPGMIVPSNLLICNTCPIDVNIVRPKCLVTNPIASEPKKITNSPATTPPDAFFASIIDPKIITFSTNQNGVAPDGAQYWQLEKSVSGVYTVIPSAKKIEGASTLLPSVKYEFSGVEDLTNAAKLKYGPGVYRLTLIASSMQIAGNNPDPDNGSCNKVFEFTVIRGAEIKCTIMPKNIGIAPQPIKLDIDVDKAYYNNSFKLIINNVKPVSFTLNNQPSIYDGIISSYLKFAGKYYIAVEAEKNPHSPGPTIPNLKPCDDPSDSTLHHCGAGLCNYTVTNKDGGGGGEIAP